MQKTVVPGVSMWSVWQPDRGLFFNSFFFANEEGNLAIDPLPLDEVDAAEIARAGGLAWIAITNRDHERAARAVASRFGAKLAASAGDAPLLAGPVDRTLADGERLGGAETIVLEGLKTAGEIAFHLRAQSAVIVGDALWGQPAGALRLMPDEKLADAGRAALSLRNIAALRPEHVLVGDGACVFGGAHRTLWACLEARTDAYVNKINLDEARWKLDSRESSGTYAASWSGVDFQIGAEKLGYLVARIRPGKSFCPSHWHAAEEELFIVTEGEPTLLTPRGNWKLRKGDFVSFPTRASGTHKLVNESSVACEVIMIANADPSDVCYYPDSSKLLIERSDLLLRDNPVLDYYDGE